MSLFQRIELISPQDEPESLSADDGSPQETWDAWEDSGPVVNQKIAKIYGLEVSVILGVYLCQEWLQAPEDGWFICPQKEVVEQMGISNHIQGKATRTLAELGILKVDRDPTMAVNQYRFDHERLRVVLKEELLEPEHAEELSNNSIDTDVRDVRVVPNGTTTGDHAVITSPPQDVALVQLRKPVSLRRGLSHVPVHVVEKKPPSAEVPLLVRPVLERWQEIGVKHNPGTQIFEAGVRAISQVMAGTFFRNKPQYSAQYGNTRFTAEDVLFALNNYNLARNDAGYFPQKKEYLKRLSLAAFFYDSFSAYATDRSLFLKYLLTPPREISSLNPKSQEERVVVAISDLMAKIFKDVRGEEISVADVHRGADMLYKEFHKNKALYLKIQNTSTVLGLARVLMETLNAMENITLTPQLLNAAWPYESCRRLLEDAGYTFTR
jgi:hypothetical protein